MESFVIGIVSGLLTTALVFIFRVIWLRIIQPWYEELIYKDAHIEGSWNISYPQSQMEEVAVLKRKGHRAWGIITSIGGADKGKSYSFEGTFKNLILSVSYSSLSDTNLDRGMFALMLKGNGNTFEGYCAFYNDDNDSIDSSKSNWART